MSTPFDSATEVAPSATEEAPAEAPAPVENLGSKVAKRPPTDLEADVLTVCQSFAAGTIKLPDEKKLTPHAIAKFVEANRSDDSDVSTGAVSDCLKRWVSLGFAVTSEKPIAFAAFAGASSKDRLNELKTQRRESLAAVRAEVRAAKEAAKAAEKATEPETASDPTPVAEQQAPIEPNDTPQPGF